MRDTKIFDFTDFNFNQFWRQKKRGISGSLRFSTDFTSYSEKLTHSLQQNNFSPARKYKWNVANEFDLAKLFYESGNITGAAKTRGKEISTDLITEKLEEMASTANLTSVGNDYSSIPDFVLFLLAKQMRSIDKYWGCDDRDRKGPHLLGIYYHAYWRDGPSYSTFPTITYAEFREQMGNIQSIDFTSVNMLRDSLKSDDFFESGGNASSGSTGSSKSRRINSGEGEYRGGEADARGTGDLKTEFESWKNMVQFEPRIPSSIEIAEFDATTPFLEFDSSEEISEKINRNWANYVQNPNFPHFYSAINRLTGFLHHEKFGSGRAISWLRSAVGQLGGGEKTLFQAYKWGERDESALKRIWRDLQKSKGLEPNEWVRSVDIQTYLSDASILKISDSIFRGYSHPEDFSYSEHVESEALVSESGEEKNAGIHQFILHLIRSQFSAAAVFGPR